MKKIIQIFIILLLANLLIISNLYSKSKAIAKVSIIKGRAYYKATNTKKFKRLKVNQKLVEGTIVKTSKKSKLTLKLRNGSLIELKDNSKMLLNKTILNNASVSLIKGKAKFKIKKLIKQKVKFNVYTPTAVAGVRGTEYDIIIGEDGSTMVKVDTGKVSVKNEKSETIVNKNQSAEASVDTENISKEEKQIAEEEWAKKKKEKIKKQPVDLITKIDNKLGNTLENQKKALEKIDSTKPEEKEKTTQNIDNILFNQAKSEGLYIAAKNIKTKNKKNKKVKQIYKKIKSIYSKLEKLNNLINEKFEKLDKIYEEHEKKLDKKLENVEKKLDEKFKDMDFEKEK